MITIDGSYGEGGGQILRSSLTLSLLTGKAFIIYNLRAKRKKPGLRPQHLACVWACRELTQANTEGEALGSTRLLFIPRRKPEPGHYFFTIGTAGSTSLLFQTLFLPLAMTGDSTLILEGGTHVPQSPPFHYLKLVYLPLLYLMGFKAELTLVQAGFYPQGKGKIKAIIKRSTKLELPNFPSSLTLEEIEIISLISKLLPKHILERQAYSAFNYLKENWSVPNISVRTTLEEVESASPGTMCFIGLKGRLLRAGFSALGEKGLPAEEVGKACAKEALEFLKTGAQMDPYLADQIMLPLAYALYLGYGERFSYTTSRITNHLVSQAWLIPHFFEGIKISLNEDKEGKGVVSLERS